VRCCMSKHTRTRRMVFVIHADADLDEDAQHDQLNDCLNHIRETVVANPAKFRYLVCCFERGTKEGRLHIQGYVNFSESKTFSQAEKLLRHPVHDRGIKPRKAKGSPYEASSYIWDQKLLYPDHFFEHGPRPQEGKQQASEWDYIMHDIVQGNMSEYEVMLTYPSAYARYQSGIKQMCYQRDLQSLNTHRDLHVTYLYGATRTGKTWHVLNEVAEHPSMVYRVTNYKHPFDGYQGQPIVLFEEFRSSLPIEQMLVYLDPYVCQLPSRYADRIGTFTQVFIVTNIPIEEQYPNVQAHHHETWDAFRERIDVITEKRRRTSDGDTCSLHDFETDND
jgi:hypothetical protein